VVQALLGHANARTTQRYAHLASDTLTDATEIVDGIVAAQPRIVTRIDLSLKRALGRAQARPG
jgi:hypothetical protein